MAIRQDCPICGRRGNEGHVRKDSEDEKVNAFAAVGGGIAGFCLGGPVGAAVGAAAFHKIGTWLSKKSMTDEDGNVWYRFNCMNPDCKHTWISRIKE